MSPHEGVPSIYLHYLCTALMHLTPQGLCLWRLLSALSKSGRNPRAKTGIPQDNRSEQWEQFIFKKRKKKRRHVINVAVSWLSTSAAPFILTMIIWRCLFVGPEVYYLQPGHQTLIWREILNNLNIVPVYNPIERLILHLFTAFHFKVWTWIYERLLWFVAKWQKRCHHLLTKTETRQLYLPGKRESRRRMNQENPFIGVSIQGATTTAQVSSSPVERPPYFSLASRSAIDCCEDPLGAAGLIDSGAARHRSSSLLYPPRVQDRPIHPCPISEPYPFFLSDPGDEYTHWFLPLWRL